MLYGMTEEEMLERIGACYRSCNSYEKVAQTFGISIAKAREYSDLAMEYDL